jgi:hypothetical protein
MGKNIRQNVKRPFRSRFTPWYFPSFSPPPPLWLLTKCNEYAKKVRNYRTESTSQLCENGGQSTQAPTEFVTKANRSRTKNMDKWLKKQFSIDPLVKES